MDKALRCPNPKCNAQISRIALNRESSCICPICGKKFPLPTQLPESEFDVVSVNEEASGFGQIGHDDIRFPVSSKRGRYRPRRQWPKFLILILLIAAFTAVVLAVYQRLSIAEPSTPTVASTTIEFPLLNFRFLKPDANWQPEEGWAKSSLKASLVLKHSHPTAWLALAGKDYQDKTPSNDEARDEAIARLSNCFVKESLEWEDRPDASIDGLKGQHLVFRGDLDQEPYSGQCWILSHQGRAYWITLWTHAQDSALLTDLGNLPDGFSLIAERQGWKEKSEPIRNFLFSRHGFSLRNVSRDWEQWTPATDFDKDARLALVARRPEAERNKMDQSIAASMLVLVLPSSAKDLSAAAKAAVAHLEQQQKVLYPQTSVVPITGMEKRIAPVTIGGVPGEVHHLSVINSDKRKRYFLLAVLRPKSDAIVLQGECAWEDRQTWEPQFLRVVATLDAGGKGKKSNAQ